MPSEHGRLWLAQSVLGMNASYNPPKAFACDPDLWLQIPKHGLRRGYATSAMRRSCSGAGSPASILSACLSLPSEPDLIRYLFWLLALGRTSVHIVPCSGSSEPRADS